MNRLRLSGLVLALLAGDLLGCGKEDPPVKKGVNPMEERAKAMEGQKDKTKHNPMKPPAPPK